VVAVAVEPDERLQQRCGEGGGEGDQAYLAEVQMEGVAQQRINRGQQRLHRVVEKMAKADGQQNFENGFFAGVGAGAGVQRTYFGFRGHLQC